MPESSTISLGRCHVRLFQSQNVYVFTETSIHSGNLNSETPGDSENVFLHWGYVLILDQDA